MFGAPNAKPPAFGTGTFSFGATQPNPAQPTFGGFGATQNPQPTTQPTFGGFTATQNAPAATGFNFGATTAPSSAFNFGGSAAPAVASTGFSGGAAPTTTGFGVASTPAPSGGFNFGANTSTTSFSGFGAASTQPAPVASGFGGATTTASTGFNLGGTNTGLNFGAAPATTAPTLGFGAAPTTTGPSLGFGAAPATTAPTLGFGAAPTTTAPTSGFGAAPATTAPTLGFGAAPTSTGASLGFGAATTTTTPLFGVSTAPATTVTATSLFPTSTAPTTTASLFGATVTSSTTGLSFGAATTSTATTQPFPQLAASLANPTSTGFSTGTTPSTGFSFGQTTGFAASTAAPTSTLNFSQTTTLPTLTVPTSSVGLGGTGTLSTGLGGNLLQTKSSTSGQKPDDVKSLKENVLPNEIAQLVDTFKGFVKEQKSHSSDIARASLKPIRKVHEDIDALKVLLTDSANGLIANRQMTEKLKLDIAKSLSHCEMAQRTHDTPPGFQYDNNAPLHFFVDTVNRFETDMNIIKMQIEEIENHIQSLEHTTTLTTEEVTLGMRRLHNTFVALAGRLQQTHTRVESQKEQYLNIRKHLLKDTTNVFEGESKLTKAVDSIQDIGKCAGPSPFSTLGNIPYSYLSHNESNPATGSTTPYTSMFGASGPTFKPQLPTYSSSVANVGTSSLFNTTVPTSGLQLQQPPLGNKRGKF